MKFERENLFGAKTPQMGDRLSRRQQNVFGIFFSRSYDKPNNAKCLDFLSNFWRQELFNVQKMTSQRISKLYLMIAYMSKFKRFLICETKSVWQNHFAKITLTKKFGDFLWDKESAWKYFSSTLSPHAKNP